MKNGRIPSIKAKLKTKNKKSMPFSLCLFHYFSFLPLSSLMLPISLSLLHYLTHAHIISLLPSVSVSNYQFFPFFLSTLHITYRPILSSLNHSVVYPQSLSPQLLLSFLPSLRPSFSSQVLLSSTIIYPFVNSSYSKQRNQCHVKKIE